MEFDVSLSTTTDMNMTWESCFKTSAIVENIGLAVLFNSAVYY